MRTQQLITTESDLCSSSSCSLQVISYKWLARKFGLPCNLAKQTLFAFLEQHRGKVKATYLLAGWTKTDPRQHTVQLVDSEHLSTRRSALDPVTSMHVYSLQPTQPKVCANSSSLLWQTRHIIMCAAETVDLVRLLRLHGYLAHLVCRMHQSFGIMMPSRLQSCSKSSGLGKQTALLTTGMARIILT